VAAIGLFASAPAGAQFDLFTWTPQLEGSSPGASWSVTAEAMHLVGADDLKSCFRGSSVALVTTAPADGTVLVCASFASDDHLIDLDWGLFVVDGVVT
jgi:hypothetical protein